MDADDDQPTQATQNVLDPRRVGKQNSGFSDDQISEVLCVLHPYSANARREVLRISREDSQHIAGKDDVEGDYYAEDDASVFQTAPRNTGSFAIVLKLSARVKNARHGFTFGRNLSRCDICFTNDPLKRLSNIHFRIYVNEYGVVMLEDQSTNGTIVDNVLLKARDRNPGEAMRMLTSGSKVKILMHSEDMDLEFLVRIPRREGDYDTAYTNNVAAFFKRLKALSPPPGPGPAVINPGPKGVDLFKLDRTQQPRQHLNVPPNETTQDTLVLERMPREWNGSEKYNRVGTIGKGAFAVVYKVTSKYDGNPYAAKELDKRRFMKNGLLDEKVENEMNIMQRVEHPNIVKYVEHLEWDNRLLIIIMEYVSGGDLGKFVNDHGSFGESSVKAMSSQLLDALGYLHQKNITHRDVKPDNILINSVHPLHVKLTDFGLSKMVDNDQTFLRTFCGTLLYCAPEVYSEFAEYDESGKRYPRNKSRHHQVGQRYGHAVDIWSLGGVLFYALTGNPPYPVRSGASYSELLHQIMTTNLDASPLQEAGLSPRGTSFLGRMLEKRPELRATISQLQRHPWLRVQLVPLPPGAAQSFDEVSDDDLPIQASQLSIDEQDGQGQLQSTAPPEVDMIDEYDSEDSGKENTILQKPRPPRLFGEVNVSAIGSSGVVPPHRLNLPVSDRSAGETIILDSDLGDSLESGQSHSSNRQIFRAGGMQLVSVGTRNQSTDQLHSLVQDVESQSLGRSSLDSGNHGRHLSGGSHAVDFNTSKRKPPEDTSSELEDGPSLDKPTLKRLRSENQVEPISEETLEEYRLLASIPPIQRQSARQIDRPVPKQSFWVRTDASTTHLDYPEMTQLQYSAFKQAAREKGQAFGPGNAPLWQLAMKYFPPRYRGTPGDEKENSAPDTGPRTMLQRDDRKMAEFGGWDIPSTAPIGEFDDDLDSLPDTLPPETQIIVPVHEDHGQNRMIALFESAEGSVIQGLSIPVKGAMLSWGRSPGNTDVFQHKAEARIPKFAFKVLLWKDGFDPSRGRDSRPWQRAVPDEDSFAFYISTKATKGLHINDVLLESHESKHAGTASKHWIRLFDGDEIRIWGPDLAGHSAKMHFKCFWGGSSRGRPAAASPMVVSDNIARRLDEICLRLERKARSDAEYKQRENEAIWDHAIRERNVEQERKQSTMFEKRRQEAIDVLSRRNASRRSSPLSVGSTTGMTPRIAAYHNFLRRSPEQ